MNDRTQILGPVKVELGRDEMNLLRRISNTLEKIAPDHCKEEHLHFDEDTLHTVHIALLNSGLSSDAVVGAIHALQNNGILFRVRRPSS